MGKDGSSTLSSLSEHTQKPVPPEETNSKPESAEKIDPSPVSILEGLL
jgi:hypothetical protein